MAVEHKNVLIRMREMRGSLTPVGRRLADHILEDPGSIPDLSIKDLALRSGTSGAAVIRFCRSMGFDGYRSFIIGLSAAVGAMDEEGSDQQFQDIRPGDDMETIVHNISASNHRSIDDTLSVLDLASLEQAVELLLKAEKLIFCGLGASGLVCMDAQQKFMRINKTCMAHTDSHAQLMAAVLLGPQDAAVLVSNSGETVEVLDTLEVLRSRGVPTIAITRYGRSTLAAEADIVLYLSTPELLIRSAAMGSRIAMLNIIDVLYAGVVSRDYARVERHLSSTRSVITSRRQKQDRTFSIGSSS